MIHLKRFKVYKTTLINWNTCSNFIIIFQFKKIDNKLAAMIKLNVNEMSGGLTRFLAGRALFPVMMTWATAAVFLPK
jgi:hypothetical protein